MAADFLSAVPVVLAGVGGIVWAVRLEGRLTTHEATDKLRFDSVDEKLEDVQGDVKTLVQHLIPPSKRYRRQEPDQDEGEGRG